ncbi:RpiR family transcriptional regulator [Clostridium thermosuccinogenes]|jgi:DNA-binding MurR/RpiR family transcriptional regulator|uniref:RpiR family transcriptional regulator n=1 Tax=Clostridium thermosuccinogenes TaxID=84032 RepID=A0A2K2F7G1_9CLOT|nr:SIS domain-containing protein [Pseudoclostridium thermosuccinogenes]AUS94976.1 RpiR family transcriptional regulator [Pseudoclostridium thermosuccinogenes]PNT91347.1 RpiR family transcriptional regulator [Pseudoclostridium thermosuccinogenes]PNT94712.1 RpiR family transcriptional regulator [Pseudoclostridium thermosuccinogenes]PNT95250.1 RpiR family transcriptional regulator [Pseudoclostridium thermosuccinogenes]
MINIDFNRLNPLERNINETLMNYAKQSSDITINEAAEICGCSISKISKFVKKLGFSNFKEYVDFLYGRWQPRREFSAELERLKNFINDFDVSLVDEFVELMQAHEKIILFGYGPSFICAQYFEYKLRIVTNKVVIAVPDEVSVENLMDDTSLLVIFSATGQFKSFDYVNQVAKEKGCSVLLIIEEYNPNLQTGFDRIFWLSKYPQPQDLKPYEKSRTVFFIFIEEVIQRLIADNRRNVPISFHF